MAEFVDVVKQKARMCRVINNCTVCGLSNNNNSKGLNCSVLMMEHPEEADKIIMEWAAAHPEPKYPSWDEAWKQLFPDAYYRNSPCPNCFLQKERSMPCRYQVCTDCKSQPIPADIAEKLGVKPLEGGNDRG